MVTPSTVVRFVLWAIVASKWHRSVTIATTTSVAVPTTTTNASAYEICSSPPQWTSGGQRVMDELLGNVTLLALVDLSDTFCQMQIKSLERLADVLQQHYQQGTKFLIVSQYNHSSATVERYRRTMPEQNFLFLQETASEPVWSTVKGRKNDFFVYDSCGRLNFYIPYPQSFLYYHYTIQSLHIAHRDQRCGVCDLKKLQKIRLQRIKAWIQKERNHRDRVVSQKPTATTTARPQHKHRHGNRPRGHNGGSSSTHSVGLFTVALSASTSAASTSTTAEVTTMRIETPLELDETTAQIPTAPPVTEPLPRKENESDVKGEKTKGDEHNKREGQVAPARNKPHDAVEKTPVRVHYAKPVGDCTSYTDSVCYEQQLSGAQLHACCRKGVYITDMCSAGRCHEHTQALCCFQKFQQARYMCCHDEDVPHSKADDFNHCCYRHFAGNADHDDPCCNHETALRFWRYPGRIADLCLPNVKIDYSDLSIDVKLLNGTEKHVELKDLVALHYDCPYVKQRSTFYSWRLNTDK